MNSTVEPVQYERNHPHCNIYGDAERYGGWEKGEKGMIPGG